MDSIILTPPAGLRQWLALYVLYRTTFPRAERKPFSLILRAYRRGKTDIWCILDGKTFLGFAATMNSPQLVLLDYFVVAPQHRGQGIGSQALKRILEHYAGREFLLEIESPYELGPEQHHRQKRKDFYVNCGLEPLHIMADVFGIPMELLGKNCTMTFDRYHNFYRDFYRAQAAGHIKPLDHPQSKG